MTPNTSEPDVRSMLVLANHILVAKDVLDAYGHVSVRHPVHRDRFYLSRSLAPASVQLEDILEYDLSSNPTTVDAPAGYIERFIHSEIYRARPDVHAVVHSHSRSMVAFGAAGAKLQPVYHMGACVAGHAVFDIRDTQGDSDMLIRDPGVGRHLASALGRAIIVLMRGHGSTCVGSSLPEAVFRSVYAEANADIQIRATPLGTLQSLSPGEAEHCLISQRRDAQRAWDVWCQEVR